MEKLIKCLDKKSVNCVALSQAVTVTAYISLVGLLFWKGNVIFGKVPNFCGPIAFLILFVVSALITTLLVLGYPFIVFWDKKEPKKAIRVVLYTTLWLLLFLLLVLVWAIVF